MIKKSPGTILNRLKEFFKPKFGSSSLPERERLFKTLVEKSPDMIVRFDKDYKHIYCNEAVEHYLGIPGSAFLGKSFTDIFGFEEPFNAMLAVLEKASKTGELQHCIQCYPLPTGEKYFQTRVIPEKNGRGAVETLLAVTSDITDLKQSEKTVQLERKRLSLLLENFPGYIYLQAPDYTIRYANQSFINDFGEPRDRFCYEVLWDRNEPCETCPTFRVFETGLPQVWEWSEGTDGKYYMIYNFPFVDSDGSELVLEIGVDISDRKMAENKLMINDEELTAIYENAPLLMALINQDLKIEKINRYGSKSILKAADAIVGMRYGEALGCLYALNSPGGCGYGPDCEQCMIRLIVLDTHQTGRNYNQVELKFPVLKNKNREYIYFLVSTKRLSVHFESMVLVSILDITGRKKAESALIESEEKHRRLFETMEQGVVYQDAAGLILTVNPAAERILGLSAARMVGRTSLELAGNSIKEDGSALPTLEHPNMVALRSGKPVGPFIMGVYKPRQEDYIWLSVIAVPLFKNGESTPHQVYSTFIDITEKRRAEQNYQMLFHKMLNGFALHEIICNEQGEPVDYRFLVVNPAFEQMTGLKSDQIIGRTIREVLPGTEDYWIKTYGNVALTGEPVNFENYTAVLEKHFHVTAFRPALNQFACIFADITDRKKQEEILKREQQEKAVILNNLSEQVAFLDLEMRLIWANHNASERHRLSTEDYTGQKCYEAYHQLSEPCSDCPIVEVIKTGKTGSGVHRSPDERYWQVTGTPIKNELGEMVGVLDTALDITDLKLAEEALKEFNLELEERVKTRTAELENLNRELDAFTYSVSHDLRSPLRRIEGFSQALLEEYSDHLDTRGLDYLQRISVSTAAMDDLIEDLLKLSRVTRHEISHEPIELSVLVRIYAKMLQEKEPYRQVQFQIEPSLVTEGDTSLLRIVLENLLDNAWKYSAKRESAIIRFGSQEINGRTAFFIADNGVGFDMAYADKLFIAFQRLHPEKEYPGTGIGLSIVSRIINRHGGELWAQGAVDQGATIFFSLP